MIQWISINSEDFKYAVMMTVLAFLLTAIVTGLPYKKNSAEQGLLLLISIVFFDKKLGYRWHTL